MSKALISFALAACVTASPALAQSLKLKEAFSNDRIRIAELARETNAACGSAIAFLVDYSTYSDPFADDNNQNPWAYMANATDALKRVCQSDDGKQAVQARINSVVVANGDSESESLTAGVFRYTLPYAGHSPRTVIEWLQSNL